MPDLQTRLIEAAVRPFADNAEMKLSASRLLETQISPSPSQGCRTKKFKERRNVFAVRMR